MLLFAFILIIDVTGLVITLHTFGQFHVPGLSVGTLTGYSFASKLNLNCAYI